MSGTPDAAAIKKMARHYLASGTFGDPYVSREAAIADPRLIVGPRSEPHSWLVGLTIGDRLAALFQFLLDGTVMRYATFQRRPGDLTHCPPAVEWLDPMTARTRVAAGVPKGTTLEEPFLTFDRSPDRVVWAVRVNDPDGRQRTVLVAGDSVYEPPTSPTFG